MLARRLYDTIRIILWANKFDEPAAIGNMYHIGYPKASDFIEIGASNADSVALVIKWNLVNKGKLTYLEHQVRQYALSFHYRLW